MIRSRRSKAATATLLISVAAAFLVFSPGMTGMFHAPAETDDFEQVFSSMPQEENWRQLGARELEAQSQEWVKKQKVEGVEVWENTQNNLTRLRYAEEEVGIEITASDINWNGTADVSVLERFDGLQDMAWVEMQNLTENYTARVILPGEYSKVQKCEGSPENPRCYDIGKNTGERPYYETVGGKTVVKIDHFSGVAGLKKQMKVRNGRFLSPASPGNVNVTSVGFEPDLVTFRLTATNDQFNTTTVEGSQEFGWGYGFAKCQEGSCTEVAQSTGSGSASTDAHYSASSGSSSVLQVFTTDAGGTFNGYINGTVTGTYSSGFNVEFEETQQQEYVTYTAYNFPDDTEVDVGSFQTRSSTGTQSISTGFKPNFLRVVTSPDIQNLGFSAQDSTDHGWTHGFAANHSGKLEQMTMSTTLESSSIDSHVWAANDSEIIHTLWKADSGNIDGRLQAELESFDSTGFNLDYTNVNPDTAEGSQFLVTYWAVNSSAEPDIGTGTTPASATTEFKNTDKYLESVSFLASNTVNSTAQEGYSGDNNPEGHWGWMTGAGNVSSQQSIGFSSHSSSVDGHASGSSNESAFRLLYTDVDGNIIGEERATLTELNRTGFGLDWSNTTSSATADIRIDNALYTYWGFEKSVPVQVNEPEIEERPVVGREFNVTVNVSTPGELDTVLLNLTDDSGTLELQNAVMINDSKIPEQYYYAHTMDIDDSSKGLWTADIAANNSVGVEDTNSTSFYSLEPDWFDVSFKYRHNLTGNLSFGSISGRSAIQEGFDPMDHWIYGTVGNETDPTYAYHQDSNGGGWNATRIKNETEELCQIQTLPENNTRCPRPPQDLQGFWTFDQQGPVAWDQIKGRHGTLAGGVTQGATGIQGQSYSLAGGNEEVDTGLTASAFNTSGSKPKTIMAWVYPRSWADNAGVWSTGGTGTAGEDFSMRQLGPGEGGGEGQWRAQLWGGADVDFTFGGNDQWHHLAMTYDGSTLCVYANGTEIACNAESLNTADTDTLNFGEWDGGYIDARIDGARVYDRALSQAEIKAIQSKDSPLGAEEEKPDNPLKVEAPKADPDPVEETATVNITVNVTDLGDEVDAVLLNLTDDEDSPELTNIRMNNGSEFFSQYWSEYTIPDEAGNPGTWTATVYANNTLGYSKNNTASFEVVEKDDLKPEWRRLDDDTGGSIIQGSQAAITVEFLDNVSGIQDAYLATNETGSFENKSVYGSPEDLGGAVDRWEVADFNWDNASFNGTLGYRIWGVDKAGNWEVTDRRSFEVTIDDWFNKSMQYRHLINSSTDSEIVAALNGTDPVNENFDPMDHWIYGTLNGANGEDLYAYHQGNLTGEGWNVTQVANRSTEYCSFQTQPSNYSSCSNPPEDLKLYYTFDENGSFAWDHIKGRHGTLAGGVTQEASSRTGDAYSFDGSNDYVTPGLTASELNIDGNKPKTIMAWVYPRGTWDDGGIWSVGSTGSDGQDFSLRELQSEGDWRTQLWGGSCDQDFTFGSSGQWLHMAMTWNGSHLRVYGNGSELVDSTLPSCTVNTGNDMNFNVGWWAFDGSSVNFIDGRIDGVRVYDRALSQSEVQTVYDSAAVLEDEEEIDIPPAFNSWYNESWLYRKPYNINNTADQELSNFQVKIELDSGSVGPGFNWTRDRNATRFTIYEPEIDNETELNYWIEDWNSGGENATIWVNVTEIPASSKDIGMGNGVARIYHYYGNSGAEPESKGEATMELFDNFSDSSIDSSKWTTNAGSQAVETGGNLELTGGWNSDGTYFATQENFSAPKVAGIRARNPDSGDGDFGTGFAGSQTADWLQSGETWTNFDAEGSGGGNNLGDGKGIQLPSNTSTSSAVTVEDVNSRDFERHSLIHTSSEISYYDSETGQYQNASGSLKDPFYFHLAGDTDDTSNYDRVDWVFLRKYVSPQLSSNGLGEQSLTSLSVDIDEPQDFTQKTRGDEFLMNGSVECTGSCGEVNVSAQYETQTTPTEIWREDTKESFSDYNSSTNVSIPGDSLTLETDVQGSPWWNTEWKFRKDFNVSNPSGTNLTNYTVDFVLNSSNVGSNFEWSEDRSEIRFGWYNSSASENVELDYWIEEWNSTGENATVWVKMPELESGVNTRVQMYYGNDDADYEGDADSVFSIYFNFSETTINGGNSQNLNGNYKILENGTSFRAWGNSWFVHEDFGSFDVNADGSQILEMNLLVDDCGDIISTGLQDEASIDQDFHYEWCGAQNWPTYFGDQPYNAGNLNTWQDVNTVLEDFSQDPMTHLHLPAEDDASNEGPEDGDSLEDANATFSDVRIRKYVSSEPQVGSGSEQEISFKPSGRYVSSVFDTNQSSTEYEDIYWDAGVPQNTSLDVYSRTSDDNVTWSSWFLQSNDSTVFAPDSRYIQYRVDMSTEISNRTPDFMSSSVEYKSSSSGWQDMEPSGTLFTTSNPYQCGNMASGETCKVTWNVTPQQVGRYFLRFQANTSKGLVNTTESRDIDVYAKTFTLNFDSEKSLVGRGREVFLKARLLDDFSNPLEGYEVNFSDTTNNSVIDIRNTNSTGWANVTYEIPKTASLGSHDLLARFPGSGEEYLLSSNATAAIDVSSVPQISNVTAEPNSTGYGYNVTLNANVTDATGVDTVLLNVTGPNSSWETYDMALMGGDTYSYEFSDTWTRGNYEFNIIANNTDGVSNRSGTEDFAVEVDAEAYVETEKDDYRAKKDVKISPFRDDWFNSGWGRRIPINIQEQSGETLTDQAVKLNIDTQRYITQGLMNDNASDVRFTAEKPIIEVPVTVDNSGLPERNDEPVQIEITDPEVLSGITSGKEIRVFNQSVSNPYDRNSRPLWVEEVDSEILNLWVNVDMPAGATETFYLYYGDTDASSISSYEDTFSTKIGETETVQRTDSWAAESFQNSYSSSPVVIGTITSFNEGGEPAENPPDDAAVPRIRSLDSSGFDIRVEEYVSDDGNHVTENISYLAIKPGNWLLSDARIEAGTATSKPGSEVYEKVDYSQPFTGTPVFMTQINSYNEADAGSHTRQDNVTGVNGWFKIEEEAEGDAHASETVGYVAMETESENQGEVFESGLVSGVTDDWFYNGYNTEFGDEPALVGKFQTDNGPDNMAERIKNRTTEGFNVSTEETPAFDDTHTDEEFGYFASDEGVLYGAPYKQQPSTTVGTQQQVDSIQKQVPYYLDSGVNTTNTTFWVKPSTLPANSESTINMYFNNTNATETGSNLSAVTSSEPEIGKVTAPADGGWTTVDLNQPFEKPMVFATSNSENSTESPKVTQVRNVNSSAFEIRLCEEEGGGCDTHPEEQVSYAVFDRPEADRLSGVDTGVAELSGGDVGSALTVSYNQSLSSTPVLLAQAQNDSSTTPRIAQAVNVGTSTSDIYLCQHDGADGCNSVGATKVGWIALEPGNLPFEGEVGTTTGIEDSSWTPETFTDSYSSVPSVFATVQTNDGTEQSKPTMARNINLGGMDIRYCEHNSGDSCDIHNAEDVGWFAKEANAGDSSISYEVGYGEEQDRYTGIANLGDGGFKGYLFMVVQQETESGWDNILPPGVNDRASDTLRTVPAGDKLNVSAIWEANGGWNTDEYEPGTYRVLGRMESPSGNTLTSFTGMIRDTDNFDIINVTLELTELDHENEYDNAVNEYEVGDRIDWVNATATAINNTALDANITMDVHDGSGTDVSWGPNSTKLCGDIPNGSTCEKQWNNASNGYVIPESASSGSFEFLWNVTMMTKNGMTRFNDTFNFTIHNVPETFSSSINDSNNRILVNESRIYNFTFSNPWSSSIDDVNVTVNCGDEVYCEEVGGSDGTANLGSVSSDSNETVEFNLTTNSSTATGDYGINVTLEYINPGERRVWDQVGNRELSVRIPGALLKVLEYPDNITRDVNGSYNFTAYANNTFSGDLTNTEVTWWLPERWSNRSGNLTKLEPVQQTGELIYVNFTAFADSQARLGPQGVIINTTNDQGRVDEDSVTVDVYANTSMGLSSSDPTPDRGTTITLEADLDYDNGTALEGQNITFWDETEGEYLGSDLTGGSGIASVDYTIPSDAVLGDHDLNATYSGSSSSYTRPSDANTSVNVGEKPTINQVQDSPDPVGYGYNVTLNANVTDADGISAVEARVTVPNGTEFAYSMANLTGTTVYEYNFSETWQYGEYDYSIWTQDGSGSTFETSTDTFELFVDTDLDVKTVNETYGPKKDVNLTQENQTWWNRSFMYRKPLNVTETSGTAKNEYQVEFEIDTRAPIMSGKMNASCKDIRFVWYNSTAGEQQHADHYVDSGCNTTSTSVWVQVPRMAASSTEQLFMYYGNFRKPDGSSMEETFSYSEPRTVGYVTSNITASNGLAIQSMVDNNTVKVGSNTYLLNETDSVTVSSGIDIDTNVSAEGLVQAEGTGDTDTVISPASWSGTEFVYGGMRGTDRFCFVSPYGTANIDIEDGGSTVWTGTADSSGNCVDQDITDGNPVRVTSDLPVIAQHLSSDGEDAFLMYNATTDPVYGVPSANLYVGAGPSGASIELRGSNGASSSQSIGADSEFTDAFSGTGTAPAYMVNSTDNPIGAIQQADSAGTESTTFAPESEMTTEFGSSLPAFYIVAATPYEDTTCEFESDSNFATTSASGTNGVYKVEFGTGNGNTFTTGGWEVECDRPVWPYYDEEGDEDETSLFGWKQMRQASQTDPTVSKGGEQKQYGSLVKNRDGTDFRGYSLMTVEEYTGSGWQELEVVVNDSATGTERNIDKFRALDLASIWNSDPFYTDRYDAGRYRVNARLTDRRGNVLIDKDGSIQDNYEFNITSPEIQVNITEISVYNVTGNPNQRIYTDDIMGSGTNTTFTLFNNETYRVEVEVENLASSGTSWQLSDVNLTHEDLNPGWDLDTVDNIWYSNTSTRTDTRFEGGTFSSGAVEWDTGANGGKVDPGESAEFYYIFNATGTSSDRRQVNFHIEDPLFIRDDYSIFDVLVPDSEPPNLFNGIYNVSSLDVIRGNSFKIFARWDESIGDADAEYNSTTPLLSNDTVNLPSPNPEYWTNHTISTTNAWARGIHFAKLYAADLQDNLNASLEYKKVGIFGEARISDGYKDGDFSLYQNWEYRKPITVDNTGGSSLTDYQVPVNVSYNPNMSNNFSDLRFSWVNSSGIEEEVDHWIERKMSRNGEWAYTWVRIPEIEASSNETLYVYYNNSNATDASDGKAVLDSGLWLTQWQDGHSSNAGDESGMDSLFSAVDYSGRDGWDAQPRPTCEDNATNGNCNLFGADDNYLTYLEGWLLAPEAGTYGFGTDSDDASDVHINGTSRKSSIGGTNVANWYGGHAASGSFTGSSNSGTIGLQQGFYRYDYRHEEATGGDMWRGGWNTPSNGSYSVIPNGFLFHRKHADSEPSTSVESNVERNAITVGCYVEDTTVGNAIDNYDVKFYNESGLIATKQTNSTGWATANYRDNSPGVETLTCNITEDNARYYKTHPDNEETFTLEELEFEHPNFFDIGENRSEVNKTDTVNLFARWTDNFELDDSTLSINTSGTFQNESTLSLSGTNDWANFSYQFSSTLTPGVYGWRQYGRDTSHNYNTTPTRTIEVWGGVNISEAELVDNTIIVDNQATMECRVIDRDSGSGIDNYQVEFYNSTGLMGTNRTESDGWAQFSFTDPTTGDEDITCSIDDNLTRYYRATVPNGTDTLTTASPGADVDAPKIENGIYGLNDTEIVRGEEYGLKVFAQWNETIDNSTVLYNETSTVNEFINPGPYPENYTNYTIGVDSSWTVGTHFAKLEASDNFDNWNDTLNFLKFNVTGRAGVNWDSPTGNVGVGQVRLQCSVNDVDTSNPVANYSVDFYDEEGFLGSNETNSTGAAIYNWDASSETAGDEDMSCVITDSSELHYQAEQTTASETITLTAELNTTILSPANGTQVFKGDTVWLNSTTNDGSDPVTPDNVTWSNSTNDIAAGENATWTVGGEAGNERIDVTATKTNFADGEDNVTLEVFGFSEVKLDEPLFNQSFATGSEPTFACGVYDTKSGKNITSYPVEFFVYNATDTWVLGTNSTTATANATWSWDTTGFATGQYNAGCNVTDQDSLYYHVSNNNESETPVFLTEANGELYGQLVEPPSSTTVAQNRTFTANVSINCQNQNCGSVDATLRYNDSGTSADTAIPSGSGTPFHTVNSNTKSCSGDLQVGETCFTTWEVNATGAQDSLHAIDVSMDGSQTQVNDTADREVGIDLVLIFNVNYSSIQFPQNDPGQVVNAPGNSGGSYYAELDENSNDASGGVWIKSTGFNNTVNPSPSYRRFGPENTTWSLKPSCSYAASQKLSKTFGQVLNYLDSGDNFTQCYFQEIPYGKAAGLYRGNITIKVNATN